MGLKMDMWLTKSSFRFFKLCFIFPKLNWQSHNFCVFNPVLPKWEKCTPNPNCWVFLGDFSWKWYVSLFSTFLYILFLNLGSESAYSAKTLHGCHPRRIPVFFGGTPQRAWQWLHQVPLDLGKKYTISTLHLHKINWIV